MPETVRSVRLFRSKISRTFKHPRSFSQATREACYDAAIIDAVHKGGYRFRLQCATALATMKASVTNRRSEGPGWQCLAIGQAMNSQMADSLISGAAFSRGGEEVNGMPQGDQRLEDHGACGDWPRATWKKTSN